MTSTRLLSDGRFWTVAAFAPFFAFLLSFPFEGRTLYVLAGAFSYDVSSLLFPSIIAHFLGLALCGFFVGTSERARRLLPVFCLCSAIFSLPFFFAPSALWLPCIVATSFFCGLVVASWGFTMRDCVPSGERVLCCADVLIFSNLLMIVFNMAAVHVSARLGLGLACASALASALVSAFRYPAAQVPEGEAEADGVARPFALLCLFVFIITIDSGLMYKVLNPAFAHLEWLTSWYWALPYIAAIALMRGLPAGFHRSWSIYLGIAMIMLSFILFMFVGRGAGAYIIVDTLMLGACGIFDLFWWSIAAALLDRAKNPAKVFGGCLAANVFGVLTGGALGAVMTAYGVSAPKVAVTALAVVCVTMALLPLLNVRLLALLKEHTFLMAYHKPEEKEPAPTVTEAAEISETPETPETSVNEPMTELTEREREVFVLLLRGTKNKDVAQKLRISENTVKYYTRNIYSKYNVTSRAELIIKATKQNIAR